MDVRRLLDARVSEWRKENAEERTMSESDKRPERVKYYPRVDHAVVVQLAEVFDCGNSLLIVLETVDLFPSS